LRLGRIFKPGRPLLSPTPEVGSLRYAPEC